MAVATGSAARTLAAPVYDPASGAYVDPTPAIRCPAIPTPTAARSRHRASDADRSGDGL
jgi:hypothetical protein